MQVLDLGRVVGMSAYELAVSKGYEGTLESWLESLRYDHSDEYKQFTDTIEAAKQEILSGKEEIKLSMTQIRDLVTKSLSDIGNAQKEATEAVKAEETEAVSNINSAESGALSNISDAETNALTSLASTLDSAIRSINEKGARWEQQIEDTGTLTKTEYNQNATAKQKAFDDNAEEKQSVFDQNAEAKQTAYDQNAEQKIQEYDTHTEQIQADIGQLKEDIGDVESVTFTVKKGSTNVFDCTNITSGKILKQDIGISTSETYQDSAKGFVANQMWNVKKGDVIYTTSAYCGLCVYDANGVLQEHFNNGNKNHTITVDSAHFLRLYSSASSATYTTDFMLSIDEPLPSTYEAYKPDKKISNFINLEEKINENEQNIKDLSKSVNGIELSKNLLDNSSVIANKRPSNWAGQTIYDSYKTDGYHTFKAIPVTQNNTYYFVENGDLVNFGQLATYDKDGKYVSSLSPSAFNVNGVNVGYIIPENIAYVRGESKTSDFSNVNFKLFNGRFEKKFLKYNESAYEKKILPVVVFDFDQVVEIDARFTILKKYGFVGNVVEVATNNYEITKELIKMGYDISPYLGNHTWDYSTDEGIQNLTANIAEKLGGLETVGVYNPTMISCSGHKYSDTMEKILSSYKIDYVRCSGFIKDGVSLKKSIYENSYGTRIVVPISLGSYNGADEFNAIIDSLVDGNVPLIMPFMHTFGYDADWITQEAFEKVVSHVSDLVKNGKALCMNMHDFVAYNDTVKSIHDDYVRNMSAIFN